jgi:hypothetical protein
MSWNEEKNILSKPSKDQKFPQNLRPISLLSTIGRLFKKVILKIIQRHTQERELLNANHFGFRVRHSTTLQCMKLTDHVTLDFNNNVYMSAVFLDIEKAFAKTWHIYFLHKLFKLKCSVSLIKLISSSFSEKIQSRSKVKRLRQEIYN